MTKRWGSTARRAAFCAAITRRSGTISSRSISAPTPRRDDVPGAAEHTVAVKPIDRFARRWEALLARVASQPRLRLAVVGGGAGGVELALAAQYRLAGLLDTAPEVTLVTREGLLPSHNGGVRDLLARILEERGIRVLTDTPVAAVEPGRLIAANGGAVAFDEALWVTEASGAPWLADTGLPLDGRGFVLVDESLRSPADASVFAAGDVATMPAHPRDKAGVYAVRAGPPLADNLRRALAGRRLRRAVPQKRALALIGTGDGQAVASRGPFAAYGRGLWLLKDWIDRRWMRQIHRTAVHGRGGRRGGRGRDALRRLRREGAGRGAGARDGAARPGVEAGSLARSRQPGRRGDRVVSGRAAAVADRRFLPRDGRRPVSVRAHRGQPCARRHLRDGRIAGNRAGDRDLAAIAPGDHRAGSVP